MKNDAYQKAGLSPYLGNTAPKNKGGNAATKTLNQLCKEAKEHSDKAGRYCDIVINRVEEHNREITKSKERFDKVVRIAVWNIAALFALNLALSAIIAMIL
jgi:hypothetical protein